MPGVLPTARATPFEIGSIAGMRFIDNFKSIVVALRVAVRE